MYALVEKELRKLLTCDGRTTNGKGGNDRQERFDQILLKLKREYGISGFDLKFLYGIANNNSSDKKLSLSVRQRIGRLVRNSKVLTKVLVMKGKKAYRHTIFCIA